MHVPPPGALGSHQAIVVAWGVNAWHLGIFFKVSRVCNLMCVCCCHARLVLDPDSDLVCVLAGLQHQDSPDPNCGCVWLSAGRVQVGVWVW